MNKALAFLCGILLVFCTVGTGNSTLWDRGGGLIYDDVLNITWLQNANYAATELSDSRVDEIISAVGSVNSHSLTTGDFLKTSGNYTGGMDWWGAMAWADQLVYGGYDDWRLPSAYNLDGSGPDLGYDVSDSEMGFMYYVNLSGVSGGPIPSPMFTDGHGTTVSFQNLLADYYWSNTSGWGAAFYFRFTDGFQHGELAYGYWSAWAVRDGDVAPVPEPATMLLLASGLVGLAGLRRNFRKN